MFDSDTGFDWVAFAKAYVNKGEYGISVAWVMVASMGVHFCQKMLAHLVRS